LLNILIYLFKITFCLIKIYFSMGILRLGDIAPDFEVETSLGKISFHDWLGDSWGILFSHPADFTPVCTTELGTVANYQSEFDRRGIKVIAVSVDGKQSHIEWIKDIEETQNVKVTYPIIADEDRVVAELYEMIHPNANDKLTVRSVFIIDPSKKIRLTLTYPASTGRNFDEIIRVIDSLQLATKHPVATPANWKQGNDVIVANTVASVDIPEKFNQDFIEIKPYLRYTAQPK
jgi:thioredoxin-dependent peroxiredoxin